MESKIVDNVDFTPIKISDLVVITDSFIEDKDKCVYLVVSRTALAANVIAIFSNNINIPIGFSNQLPLSKLKKFKGKIELTQ